MEKQKSKRSLDERIEDLKQRKQRLLAEEARLVKQTKNEVRKKRLHTYYEFGGALFPEGKWQQIRQIIIEKKNYSSIKVYVDGVLVAEKTNTQIYRRCQP